MIFSAISPHTYASGDYRLYWGVKGWQLWRWIGLKQRCLGRELTLGQGMEIARKDNAIRQP